MVMRGCRTGKVERSPCPAIMHDRRTLPHRRSVMVNPFDDLRHCAIEGKKGPAGAGPFGDNGRSKVFWSRRTKPDMAPAPLPNG